MKRNAITAQHTTRRQFMKTTLTASAFVSAAMVTGIPLLGAEQVSAGIRLPPLPYPENALEPHISGRLIGFHYGKHHSGYVKNSNKLIENSIFKQNNLKNIINKTAKKPEFIAIFNNAAQVYNHTFYWNSLQPGGGGEPGGELAKRIKKTFGTYQIFKDKFITEAAGVFGSGWIWLVREGDEVKIVQTSNANTPLAQGQIPLITIDVWEHAYYLDYQNRRADYLNACMDHLINWEFAERNFVGA